MLRSRRARLLGVVLLCQGWPLLAAANGSQRAPQGHADRGGEHDVAPFHERHEEFGESHDHHRRHRSDGDGVCAELRGHDHELYGLCHAFCEAQRCDAQASFDRSCSQLLRNFLRRSHMAPPACLADRIPEQAKLISPAKFRHLVARGRLVPLEGDELETQAAAAEAQMQADLATILAFERDTGAEIQLPVEPDDPSVRYLTPESYEHRIHMKDGSERRILTLGRRWMLSRIADSIRTFPTRENQLAIYASLYEIARRAGAADLIARLVPPDEFAAHPDLYPVAEISDHVAILRDAGDNLISTLPVLPGFEPGAPDCSGDIGRGSDSDREPANPACSFDPDGLYVNATWMHKFDHTCVKTQGARGSCVAFAVTAAAELEVQKIHGLRVNLSEQALYNRMKFTWERRDVGDGFTNTKALRSAINEGYLLPFEFQWNYNQSLSRISYTNAADEVIAYSNSCDGYPETCSNSAHQSGLFCAFLPFGPDSLACGYVPPNVNPGNFGFRLKDTFQLWDPDTKNSLESVQLARLVLAGGYAVLFGIPVTPQYDAANCNDANPPLCKTGPDAGVVTYVLNEDPETFRGGHALLAVGFVDNSNLPAGIPAGGGGGYFIVKNSWGHCWGDGGYAYVPYEYFRVYAGDADVLLGVY